MSYQIQLTTRDNKLLEFTGESEQSVQEAAEAAGFFLPALCKSGSCGACFGYCQSGDYRFEAYTPSLLSASAKEKREVLLCRLYPNSDLTLTVPYPASQIRSSSKQPREAEITIVEAVAERTFRLVLQLLEDYEYGVDFEFQPGQFVELEISKLGLKRAYSIANEPNWQGILEFFIRLQPHGQFSEYVQHAKVGQYIQVHGPMGTFGVQEQRLNPRCFIAGGTGIAPFLSILRRMAVCGEDHPTHLFFGVTTEAEYFAQHELALLIADLPQLTVIPCVWQASKSWQGFVGTPVEAFQQHLSQLQNLPDVLLCGPPALVEAAIAVALAAGIPAEQILSERFG